MSSPSGSLLALRVRWLWLELAEDVELQAVGDGEVDGLVEVAVVDVEQSAGSLVGDVLGDRA